MRSPSKLLLALLFFGATFAPAQTLPHFDHIIIIVQENRTPDNLFGSKPSSPNCQGENPFELGVDIVDGGPVGPYGAQCFISLPMNSVDPNHTYLQGWIPQYAGGTMNGFCQIRKNGQCQQLSYVQASDVQPYFAIATNYGFANYFFETNEGPSFPAHQFLFTGTSAPVAPLKANYLEFDAENSIFHSFGCPDTTDQPAWVDPKGDEISGSPQCYTHDSLVTNSSGDKGITWRYYTPDPSGVIWTAPAAIPEVCYGENNLDKQGQACTATEWTGHIRQPNVGGYDGAPILDDIANCDLQQISWVIPDEIWSDHPGFDTHSPALGPSWVGNIINAIGNSWTQSLGGGKCDYWGNNSNDTTAIFVVWDDWGGWYDHVPPPAVYRSPSSTTCPTSVAPNGWGCGYVYGFRVPLLVVSEYTQAGYVSGACQNGVCQNNKFPYQHDFGSILAFTENNFGLGFIAQPNYADYNAQDWGANRSNIPLSDFFNPSNQRNFTSIPTSYTPSFFRNYYITNSSYPPTGPDGTDSD